MNTFKLRIIAYYSILLGISILGLWGLILTTEVIQEGKTEFSFHLVSELLMALVCIAAGIMMTRKHRVGIPLILAGHGMVIYSLLNATGYYAERGEIIFPVMFGTLLVLSVLIILWLLTNYRRSA